MNRILVMLVSLGLVSMASVYFVVQILPPFSVSTVRQIGIEEGILTNLQLRERLAELYQQGQIILIAEPRNIVLFTALASVSFLSLFFVLLFVIQRTYFTPVHTPVNLKAVLRRVLLIYLGLLIGWIMRLTAQEWHLVVFPLAAMFVLELMIGRVLVLIRRRRETKQDAKALTE